MNARIKNLLGRIWTTLGAGRIHQAVKPGYFAVLMFHRVVDAATLRQSANAPLMVEAGVFEALAAAVARECRCLSLPEAQALARNKTASPRPVVVLTFDDGYGDFGDTVFPLLVRYNLPATMYLSTGFLDNPDRFFWWDAVETFFAAPRDLGGLVAADLPETFLDAVRTVTRAPSPQAVEAFIRGPMRQIPPQARDRFLGLLQKTTSSRPAILTWDHVRTMAASGLVDFGAHCVNHPFLDELDPGRALEEITTSKRRIEEETGRAVTSFAYPSGRVPAAYTTLLEEAGIGLAVTTRFGGNDANSHPRLLNRMDARLCLSGDMFDRHFFLAACTGGLDWLHRIREARL